MPSLDEVKKAAAQARAKLDSKMSSGRAAWEGIKDSVSFGFGDEIAGLGEALAAPIVYRAADVDPAFRPTLKQAYKEGRDEARRVSKQAGQERPVANALGSLAGGLLTAAVPGLGAAKGASIPKLIAQGAGIGAVQGAGAAKELDDVPESALKGAAIGGAVGGGLGAAQKGTKALGQKAKDMAASADDLRILTADAGTGGRRIRPPVLREAERVPGGRPEMAKVMRETPGLAPKLGSGRRILDAAEEAKEQANDVITAIIESVDNQKTKVDSRAFADRLRSEADALAERPELDDVAELLRARADLYEQRFPDGLTMRQAQQAKTDLANRVSWTKAATGMPIPRSQDAAKTAARAMANEMDSAAEEAFSQNPVLPLEVYRAEKVYPKAVFPSGAPDTAKEAYRRARRVSQVSDIVADTAQEAEQRASKNRVIGMRELQAGQIGADVGGLPAALGLGALLRLTAPYGATARATTAEQLKKVVNYVEKHPEALSALEDVGSGLQAATQRGPQGMLIDGAMPEDDKMLEQIALAREVAKKRKKR